MTSPLTPEQVSLIKQVLDDASRLRDAARERYIDEALSSPELRQRVRALLAEEADDEAIWKPVRLEDAASRLDAPPDRSGDTLGGYRLERRVGWGAMGEVYEGTIERAGRHERAAIKLLRLAVTQPLDRLRFEQERHILAGLSHPAVVRCFDAGVADGVPWLAMTFVEGEDVLTAVRGRPWQDVTTLFERLAAGVEYIHSHFIIHRDIKPSNMLVTADGQPVLLDFGIARVQQALSADLDWRTVTAARRHSWLYVSPEVSSGDAATTRSDIYSLGLVLEEALTGVHRFAPHGPTAGRPALPPALTAIIAKATAVNPFERYESAASFADDLRGWREGRPVQAHRMRPIEAARSWMRRHKAVAALGVVAVLSMARGAQQSAQANAAATIADGARQTAETEAIDAAATAVRAWTTKRSTWSDAMAAKRLAALVDLLDANATQPSLSPEGRARVAALLADLGSAAMPGRTARDEAVEAATRSLRAAAREFDRMATLDPLREPAWRARRDAALAVIARAGSPTAIGEPR